MTTIQMKPPLLAYAAITMISGNAGNHQEHVGEQREQVVGEATEVGRGHADEHRQERGPDPDEHRDHQRLAGAVDQLAQMS